MKGYFIKIGLMKWDGRLWTGLIWLRIGYVAGSSEHGNELRLHKVQIISRLAVLSTLLHGVK
jgi:hypothetical protein